MINFANRAALTRFLGRVLSEGRLALFLGAGISAQLQETSPGVWFGLPEWDRFIENLYAVKKVKRPKGTDPLRTAEAFRSACKSNAEYRKFVRAALYRNFSADITKLHKNPTLAAIGALVAVSRRSRVSRLITMNFDDILERYLAYSGIIVKPIFSAKFWHEAADVVVHHIHGFVPSPKSPFERTNWDDDANEIILDAFSYQKVFGDSNHRFSLIAKDIMMSNYCLFLGLSDQDDHLGSLLTSCKAANPYETEGNSFWGVSFSTKRTAAIERYWKTRGIYLQNVANWDRDFPEFLFSVCQHAAASV